MSDRRKEATTVTKAVNERGFKKLPFENTQDFSNNYEHNWRQI